MSNNNQSVSSGSAGSAMSSPCPSGVVSPITHTQPPYPIERTALQAHIPPAQRSACEPEGSVGTTPENEPHGVIRGETLTSQNTAHIDWLAFTFTQTPEIEGELIPWLLNQLIDVFGLLILSAETTGKGWNGYTKRIDIIGNSPYGLIAYGGEGQLGTCHVELNAGACARVPDWDRVLQWGESIGARITRVDLAHDDLMGEFVSIDIARGWYDAGEFTSSGRPPEAKLIDDLGSGKGKTLYIGNRANGKLLRVYEKGRQLGDSESPWVRVELELRGKSRLIPWEVLTTPAPYLAGSYPCLAYLSAEQDKIRTISNAVQISLEAGKRYLRTAGGKWLHVLMQEYQGDACGLILDLVRPGIPRRLENYGDFLPQVLEASHVVENQ